MESYSEFVPFCRTSNIIRRRGADDFDAQLSLGFLAFTEDYVSQVRLLPPRSIRATASNTPLFVQLDTTWTFDEGTTPDTCMLRLQLTMQLRSLLHDQALSRVIDRVAEEQVSAFRRRCDEQLIGGAGKSAAVASPTRVSPSSRASTAQTPARPPPPLAIRAEPAWRQRVDAAFDAHAVNESLSLHRFVEAFRSLAIAERGAATERTPPEPRAADSTCQTSGLPAVGRGSAEAGRGSAAHTRLVEMPISMVEIPEMLLASWFLEVRCRHSAGRRTPAREGMRGGTCPCAADGGMQSTREPRPRLPTQFDDDASGSISREEFRRNLWLLTCASAEEQAAHAFAKLDANGSVALL